jgi:ABC-type transporter Mla MlaB component
VLKIGPVQDNEKTLRIRLCGQLTEEYLPEIARLFGEEPTSFETISLDLANVTFVDRAAMVFLCTAKSKNIAIENCPSYVTRWMQQERFCDPSRK